MDQIAILLKTIDAARQCYNVVVVSILPQWAC